MILTTALRDFAHPTSLPPWLRVPDHALDGREAPAQAALHPVDLVVDGGNRARRVDVAVKVHDFAIGGFTYTHVVDVAQHPARAGKFGERVADRGDLRCSAIPSGEARHLQRLDVSLDLDSRAQPVAARGVTVLYDVVGA